MFRIKLYHERLYSSYKFITAASCYTDKPIKDYSKIPNIPKNLLSHGCGEDSFLHSYNSIIVADGVGGGSEDANANVSLYSRLLVHNVAETIEALDDLNNLESILDIERLTPWLMIDNAYKRIPKNLLGSTTIALAMLNDNKIDIANLGDCGFLIYRYPFGIIMRSEEQQFSFNFPFQLGPKCKSTPLDCQNIRAYVQPNDLFLMASDGFFDNLYDEEISCALDHFFSTIYKRPMLYSFSSMASQPFTESVRAAFKKIMASEQKVEPIIQNVDISQQDLQTLSESLLKSAKEASFDQTRQSPFASKAIEEGLYCAGGKPDDITLVLGLVAKEEDSPDRR
jgi:serine/threonine protein phosphatase PrpC